MFVNVRWQRKRLPSKFDEIYKRPTSFCVVLGKYIANFFRKLKPKISVWNKKSPMTICGLEKTPIETSENVVHFHVCPYRVDLAGKKHKETLDVTHNKVRPLNETTCLIVRLRMLWVNNISLHINVKTSNWKIVHCICWLLETSGL